MHSSFWLVAPLMALVTGVILLSQGLWRSAQHNSAKEQRPAQARITVVRTVLFWVGVFLTIWAARLAFGFLRR